MFVLATQNQNNHTETKLIKSLLVKDPRSECLPSEETLPKDQRSHQCGCKQQEVYSNTQVPGATKSLGGLARRQAGARGFYGVLE